MASQRTTLTNRCGHSVTIPVFADRERELAYEVAEARQKAQAVDCGQCQAAATRSARRTEQRKLDGQVREMTARYVGDCSRCAGRIDIGDPIGYSRNTGAFHVNCGDIRQPIAMEPASAVYGERA